MYTIKEFIKIFKIDRTTFYHWVNKGIVKPVKIGGAVRISEEQVERLKRGEV